jgi:thioredoxin reductase
MDNKLYDVAVVGGGPAGLSAALVLARSRRQVVVCDDGRPRNYAAKTVNSYLAVEGLTPSALRQHAVEQCNKYGVNFLDACVIAARCCSEAGPTRFELRLKNGNHFQARKLLLATGVKDMLPDIKGFNELYGKGVHHCPFCDGWEHRDQRLVAFGRGAPAAKLAMTLLGWSSDVTCCSHEEVLESKDRELLQKRRVTYRSETVVELCGKAGKLERDEFAAGPSIPCDALFFSADQGQRSALPEMLGCECDAEGLIVSRKKAGLPFAGLFLAGDADGDVQFAIVAAAEGAIAATAIYQELAKEDHPA